MSIVRRKITEPIRPRSDWDTAWRGPDKGLFTCWELGRQDQHKQPEVAEAARRNELPLGGWKGGVTRTLKKLEKYGTLQYLAHWQGLRNEDLNIDTESEVTLTCTKTGMVVTYTADQSKFANESQDETANGDADDGGPIPRVRSEPLFP